MSNPRETITFTTESGQVIEVVLIGCLLSKWRVISDLQSPLTENDRAQLRKLANELYERERAKKPPYFDTCIEDGIRYPMQVRVF